MKLIKYHYVAVTAFILIFSSFCLIENSKASILSNDDFIFIHHSCGRNWLNNGLENALLDKDYIDERNDIYYNTVVSADNGRPDSLGPEPGDKTNMNHWILWFNDYLNSVIYYGCDSGINKIIMFKSCYPASNIGSDGSEPGDPFSSSKTLSNYKAVYRHPDGPGNVYTRNGYNYKPLEDVFADNPDILFIPVCAPPRHYAPSDATNDAEAHRARLFNNWLKNDWLSDYNSDNPGVNNVAVFDWFDILSYSDNNEYHPNRLKSEYGGESGNSHPNSLANSDSTNVFASHSNNFIDNSWNLFNDGNSNNPPYKPNSPSPDDGTVDQSVNVDLEWSGGDPDSGDTVSYDIYFGTSSNPPRVKTGHTPTYHDLGNLEPDSTYYWKIIAKDDHGETKSGDVWSFTTEDKLHGVSISYKQFNMKELSVNIENLESNPISNVQWSINMTGGLLGMVDLLSDGVISSLDSSSVETVVSDDFRLGLGLVNIKTEVKVSGETYTEERNGIIIGAAVIII